MWVSVTAAWAASDEVLGELRAASTDEAVIEVAAAIQRWPIPPDARDAEVAWRLIRMGEDADALPRALDAAAAREPSSSPAKAAQRALRAREIAGRLADAAPRFEAAQRRVAIHDFAGARAELAPLAALVPNDPEITWWIAETWLGEGLGATPTPNATRSLAWSVGVPTSTDTNPDLALALAEEGFSRAAHVAPAWMQPRISTFEARVAIASRDPGRLGDLIPDARALTASAPRWPDDDRREIERTLGLYYLIGGAAPADRRARATRAFTTAAALGDTTAAWNLAALERAPARPISPTLTFAAPAGELGEVAARLGGDTRSMALRSGAMVIFTGSDAYIWTSLPATPPPEAPTSKPPAVAQREDVSSEFSRAESIMPDVADEDRASTVATIADTGRARPTIARKASAPIPRSRAPFVATPLHTSPLLEAAPPTSVVTTRPRLACLRGTCAEVVVLSRAAE
jgi:hypothetical protein